MSKLESSLTAIEIGTSSIKVVMGETAEGGAIGILGHQELSTVNKVVKGEITNVAAVTEILTEALNKLETATGRRVEAVYTAVTGAHIRSHNVRANVPITSPERTISEEDVVLATRQALACNLPIDRRAIRTFQRLYLVDGTRRTSDPVGMIGNQLTADVHVIHGDYNCLQTHLQVVNDACGRPADDMCFSAIADFYGVGQVREQRDGLLIIDIGAGVTEYAVFFGDGCMHSGVLTVGCEHVANDLALGLGLPISRCRELLRRNGSALRRADSVGERIKVETTLGQPPRMIRKSSMQMIIEARLRELLQLIRNDLEQQDVLAYIGNRAILCGGGALIPDLGELAESVFHVPVSVGYPVNVTGRQSGINSPRFVTTAGLLHLGHQLQKIEPAAVNSVSDLCRLIRDDFLRFARFWRGTIRL